jgi:DNA-binding transcriptional MerR regulator
VGTVTSDTLKFVKRLEEAGMSQKEAEAIAAAQSEAFEDLTKTKELATKTDLHELKYDLLKWIVGLAFAQLALLVGILMKLPR